MKIVSEAHPEGEGYRAMTTALHDLNPLDLHRVLRARRVDLIRAIKKARKEGNLSRATALRASFTEITEALEKNQGRIVKLRAAEEEEAQEMADEGTEQEGEAVFEEDGEKPDDLGPEPEGETPEEALTLESDEAAEAAEDQEPTNPVEMPAGLRKEIGDLTADYLDQYAHNIYKKVIGFFHTLNTRALHLGKEDDSDDIASLREVLRSEVGNRGLMRLEPNFAEWREGVIRKITKSLNEMFEAPEVPTAIVEIPVSGPDVEAPEVDGPEDFGASPVEPVVQIPGEEPVEEDEKEEDPNMTPIEVDEEVENEEKSSASTQPVFPMAGVGRVSFTTSKSGVGFKPSGTVTPKMD